MQTNDLPEAEKYLAAYIKTLNGKPDRERDATQALMVLAQIAEDRKDFPAALKWLDQVEANGQGAYLGATLKRAQLTAKGGRLDEARKLLAQTETESDDERIKLIIAEAQLLRDAGQLNEAMQVLEEALQAWLVKAACASPCRKLMIGRCVPAIQGDRIGLLCRLQHRSPIDTALSA